MLKSITVLVCNNALDFFNILSIPNLLCLYNWLKVAQVDPPQTLCDTVFVLLLYSHAFHDMFCLKVNLVRFREGYFQLLVP